MMKGRFFLEKIVEDTDLAMEPLPGQPVVEIAGDERVLIENHQGVKAYGREKIIVKMSYGSVSVCGCDLELVKMTREQLVIRGRIRNLVLQRRG